MLQIVTEFCLLHLTASHAGCKYFFLSSKVHAENFSRRYICVCIATAVDFSIQVQMNQWKIVWLPVWMNLMYYLHGAISAVHINMTFDPLLDCCCSSEFANIPFDFHPIMAILRTIRNIFGFVRPYIGRISCVIS